MEPFSDAALVELDALMYARLAIPSIKLPGNPKFANAGGCVDELECRVELRPDGGIHWTAGEVESLPYSINHDDRFLRWMPATDMLARMKQIVSLFEARWARIVDKIHGDVSHTFRNWGATRIAFVVEAPADAFAYWAACRVDGYVDMKRVRAVCVRNPNRSALFSR